MRKKGDCWAKAEVDNRTLVKLVLSFEVFFFITMLIVPPSTV